MQRKIWVRSVSILLVVALILLIPLHALAVEEIYISDIAVGTPQTLTEAGYTVVNQNLNTRGAGAYIGYKTTTDASKAITNVQAMNMYGGYTQMNYRDVLIQQKNNLTDTVNRIRKVVAEFKNRYQAGNSCAILAYQTLNYLVVPGENGEKDILLGDYLLSEERTTEEYQELFLIASNLVMSYLINQLTMGVADDLSKADTSSWLERLCQNGPLTFDESEEEALTEGEIEEIYTSSYDGVYMQRAAKLFDAVENFAQKYTEAKERHPSGTVEVELTESESEQLTEDVCSDIKMAENASEGSGTSSEQEDVEDCEDALYLRMYAVLDARQTDGAPVYPYGVNEDGSVRTLAEFLVWVGMETADQNAYRALYPLMIERDGVLPLSYGQEIMMNFAGLTSMIAIAGNTGETVAKAKEEAVKSGQELLAYNDGKPVSVWFGVNKSFYDENAEGVYWTSKLARESAAKGRYDLLTKPQGEQGLTKIEKIKNAMIYTGIVGISALGAAYVTLKVTGYFIGIAGQTLAYTSAACIASIVGAALVAVAVVAVVVIAVLALVWLFSWLLDDEEEEIELTEMPHILYDFCETGSGSAVEYRAICTVGGQTPANLNAGVKNTPWVVLYYTTAETMGTPVRVSELGEAFVFQTDNQSVPEGYSPLCFFDSIKAANLNEGCSGAENLFCFLYKEITETKKIEGKYIRDVIMRSEKNAEAAKASIISSGYTLIDHNLTSDAGNVATYIGYQTSDNEADALTDLRVAYCSGVDNYEGSITYGGAVYGVCGNVGNLQLFETSYSCAGTAILTQDLLVTDFLQNVPEGYEPVNLFCGGPAFDFNNCGNWNLTDDKTGKEGTKGWKHHTYIFFHPSVSYSNGTEYLGGLAFFSGEITSQFNGKTYYEEMGWQVLDDTDLSGAQEGTTYLCYTSTYNPYRAVYGIKAYTAELNAQGVAYSINMGTGYAVCEVFQQGCGSVGNQRMMRVTHCYRSNNAYEGGGESDSEKALDVEYGNLLYTIQRTQKLPSPLVSSMEWFLKKDGRLVGTSIHCVSLYVTGCATKNIQEANPIRLEELFTDNSAEYDAKNTTPVRSFTDAYAEKGANLGFTDYYRNIELYLYIARPDVQRPKYVATVTIAYSGNTKTETPYDNAFYQLVSKGEGQLIEVNLAGNQNYQDEYMWAKTIYSGSNGRYDVYIGKHNSNREVAYAWVTYTNKKAQGISDLVLYSSGQNNAADTMVTADNVTCQRCGTGFRVNGKGDYYFLYAIYNNGNQITDLLIDSKPMTHDYWTTLASDGTVSTYQLRFIKAKHSKSALMTYYISGIYSASGTTEQEAQLALLAQGCRYCCPFNVNPNVGNPFYVGYSVSTSYKKGFSGLILYNAGQDNNIQKIVSGRDTYIRVLDTLNSGVYDAIIPMFVTSSARKACENGATSAKNGHYITDIVYFTSKDLNDYARGEKSLDTLDEDTRAYVESYIRDDEGNPVYWDIVTDSKNTIINCNLGAIKYHTERKGCDTITYETHTDVYMYVHYSDNYCRDTSSLLGTIFQNHAELGIVMVSGMTVLILACGIVLLRKKRKGIK